MAKCSVVVRANDKVFMKWQEYEISAVACDATKEADVGYINWFAKAQV